MADELDPALERRLSAALHHEADLLAFTLTVEDLELARRSRGSARARRWLPASLVAAAAVVLLVVGVSAWRNASLPPTGQASPNPLAADLASYDELAKGITILNGVVIAKGEDVVGSAPGNAMLQTVVGVVPANDYIDVVLDCRGQSVSVTIDGGSGQAPGASRRCADGATTVTLPTLDTPADLVVTAPAGTVWRLVVGGTESAAAAGLATFDDLAARAGVTDGEIVAQAADLAGSALAPSTETVIGSVGAIGRVSFVADCRGDGSIWVGVQRNGTDITGGSASCATPGGVSTTGDVGAGGNVVVRTDPGVVWAAVAVGTPVERLATFDQLAAVATSAHEIDREEQPVPDRSEGMSAFHFLTLGNLWNLEVAVSCTGPGEVVLTTSGTGGAGNRSTVGCDGAPVDVQLTLLDDAAQRASDASLVLEFPAGTAWRLIAYDRSADLASPPVPGSDPGPSRPSASAAAPVVPGAAFPASTIATYAGSVVPGDDLALTTRPVPEGATVDVALGCTGDPSAILHVAVDGVVADMACLEANIWQFVPAGARPADVHVASDAPVTVALDVRAFTQAQAGARLIVPGAILRTASGTSSAPGYVACTTAFAIPGGSPVDEGCGPTWRVVPGARAVTASASDALELTSDGTWALTGAALDDVPTTSVNGSQVAIAALTLPDAQPPGGDGGLAVEPLPQGDWILRATVRGRLADGTTFTAQQLFRVIVTR